MITVQYLTQNAVLVDAEGRFTPEFKRYLDQLLDRTGGIKGGTFKELPYSPIIAWDLNQTPVASVRLTGNATLANAVGQTGGNLFLYRITVAQDAVGGRALTWGSAFKFPGGVAPVITPAANAVDEFVFDSDGTNMKLIGGAQDLR